MRIKGFDEDLWCVGIQYEIGKEYKTNAEHITQDDLCTTKVLEYCDNMESVSQYYPCQPYLKNRYCEIEVLGEEVTNGDKYGSNHIKVVREIVGDELDKLIDVGKNIGYFNKGEYNYGCKNTGIKNFGRYNFGDENYGLHNHGDFNFGYRNYDYANVGRCNDGSFNTGCANKGRENTGYYNAGAKNNGLNNNGTLNSGFSNNGGFNIGCFNNGEHNIGEANIGSNNVGLFCTNESKAKLYIFNKESDITLEQWYEHPVSSIISRLHLTEWIKQSYVPFKEEKDNTSKVINDGYLKVYEYKEAWQNLWKELSDEEKELFKTIPNFDSDIFEKITGIKID